jgi:hypothetical protein
MHSVAQMISRDVTRVKRHREARVYARRVFRGVSGDKGLCKQGLSGRHREAEAEGRARRSLGASHGGKTST